MNSVLNNASKIRRKIREQSVLILNSLCLLRKDSRPLDTLSAYRPTLLLNETGNLLEKIIASRLIQNLEKVGPGLSEAQFRFRVGRSSIGALNALKTRSLATMAERDVLFAISLDVVIAFNSLPLETLREALRYSRGGY